MCFLRMEFSGNGKTDMDNERARIRMAEGDVSEQTGSIPQLVITPVESKFVAFLWVAPVSALHLKPGFHCLNEVKIGIQLYVKLCVMKPRQLHFYLLEVCPVPKEVLVQVPRLEILSHLCVCMALTLQCMPQQYLVEAYLHSWHLKFGFCFQGPVTGASM